MHVWIVQQYAVPPGRVGFTRTHDLARALNRAGHHATIIAAGFDHVLRKPMDFAAGEHCRSSTHDGVDYLWLKTPEYRGNTLGRMWNMLRFGISVALGRSASDLVRPDVIMGSSPSLFAAFGAWILACRRRCRFVMEVRDLWPDSLIDLGGYSRLNPLILGLVVMERWMYWRADLIFVVPPLALSYVRDKGGRAVVWLPNGKRLDSIAATPQPDQQQGFLFLYAGSHGLANGLHRVIEAAAILQDRPDARDIRIRLIGDGPQKLDLQTQAARLGLRNLEFFDPIPNDAVVDEQRNAHAFLMVLQDSPVFRWGISPNKLFEYLAVGRPIVYAVNAPNDPIAEAGAGVSVKESGSKALADSMQQLARLSDEERAAMAERGRAWLKQHHDLECLLDRFVKQLEAL